MTAIRFLLRWFAYLYHAGLCLFLFGIAGVGWLAGTNNFELGMLPWWRGPSLIHTLLAASLVGLLSVLLAVGGKLRILFVLWAAGAAGAMLWGFFVGNYTYESMEHFKQAVWLEAGAVLAVMGSLMGERKRKRR